MLKFYKYLLLILGISVLIDFSTLLFFNQKIEIFTIVGFVVSKTVYLIYKFFVAFILIFIGLKTKNK